MELFDLWYKKKKKREQEIQQQQKTNLMQPHDDCLSVCLSLRYDFEYLSKNEKATKRIKPEQH